MFEVVVIRKGVKARGTLRLAHINSILNERHVAYQGRDLRIYVPTHLTNLMSRTMYDVISSKFTFIGPHVVLL